jgi:hypothetical protein
MENSLNRYQTTSASKDITVDEAVSNATTISEIAVETGLTPNQLIEMYQLPDGNKKTDIKAMAEDFDNGKGVQKIQEAQKKFAQDHERLGKSDEERSSKREMETEDAGEAKESWVEKLGLEDKAEKHKDVGNEGEGR